MSLDLWLKIRAHSNGSVNDQCIEKNTENQGIEKGQTAQSKGSNKGLSYTAQDKGSGIEPNQTAQSNGLVEGLRQRAYKNKSILVLPLAIWNSIF